MKKSICLLLALLIALSGLVFSGCSFFGFSFGGGVKFQKLGELEKPSDYSFFARYTGIKDAFVAVLPENASGKITVPGEHNGKPVVALICEKGTNNEVTSLKIDEGVVYVEGVMQSASKLEELTLPSSLRMVENAFVKCPVLEELTFTGPVALITGSFHECKKLKNLTFEKAVETISCDSFTVCGALDKLSFNDDVDCIEGKESTSDSSDDDSSYSFSDSEDDYSSSSNAAFRDSIKLSELTFAGNVGYIGEDVFYNNENLETLEFAKSVDTIAPGAFSSCDALTSVTFSSHVACIDSQCFEGCDSLASVSFLGNINEINDAFGDDTSLTSLTFGGTVGYLNDAFDGCSALKTVTLMPNARVSTKGFDDSVKIVKGSANDSK